MERPDRLAETVGKLAVIYAEKYHGCAQATLAPFLEIIKCQDGSPMLASASLFSGGASRCLTCGAISAGLMVLGMKYGRQRLTDPVEMLSKAEKMSGKLIDRFKEKYKAVTCCELTGYNLGDSEQKKAFMADGEAHQKCTERIKTTTEWIAEIICENEPAV